MVLNVLALITAVSISIVAASYSIIGLTAIFSGAFWPIVIMGSVLEFGKIVTTVWLHVYWQRMGILLRTYLTAAVIVLMFITSMGIFGYLSRAHIDATSSVGDNSLIVSQLNQSIAIEQKRIDDTRIQIAQMDNAVAALLQGSAGNAERNNNRTAQLAQQATRLRQSQRAEREELNRTIDQANARIADISAQILKLEQQKLKIEAEVGPIKYIAQLIYGDEVNKDLLERAVRWVIIIIVAVFDPLAVSLILAVTMSLTQIKRKEAEQDENQNQSESPRGSQQNSTESSESVAAETARQPSDKESSANSTTPIEKSTGPIEYRVIEVEKIVEVEKPIEVIKTIEIERVVEKPVEVIKEVKVEDHERMLELAKEIDNLLVELRHKDQIIEELQKPVTVSVPALLGRRKPANAIVGQLFVQIGSQGLRVFKWNGDQWILVDKNSNDSYLLDTDLLSNLLNAIANNELDLDMLTEQEQEALARLSKNG